MSVSRRVYLTRRSNGIYHVGYLHEGEKRWKSTRARTKHEALQSVRELENVLKRPRVTKSFGEFTSEFLTYARSTFRRRAVILYEQAFGHFTRLHGSVSLSSLTVQHFDAFKAARPQKVGPVTVNMHLRCLRAALSVAVDWALVPANPFQWDKEMNVPDAQPVYFKRADFQLLMNTVREKWLRERMLFATSTGLRQGESLNLRWQDIDLERRPIYVQSSATFRTKQGRRRTIPMSDAVHALIAQKLVRRTGDLVFTRRGRPIGASYLQHRFKQIVRDVKLDDRLHWHSLRHTFASWLAQDGVSLCAIQKLLGHSSSALTQVYSHLQPHELREEVERIAVVIN